MFINDIILCYKPLMFPLGGVPPWLHSKVSFGAIPLEHTRGEREAQVAGMKTM